MSVPRIQTVTGPIDPASLGPTLMHEHVLCDLSPPAFAGLPDVPITLENCWEIRHHWSRHPGNHRLFDRDVAVAELAAFRDAGGSAVVDLTTAGIVPDPDGLRAVSARAGVAVVMGCGTYVEAHAGPALTAKSTDGLAGEMIAALTGGVGESSVQAGIIGEIGVSDPCSAAEGRALVAAALAQGETGASINVHPGRDPASPFAVVETIRGAGGDPARLERRRHRPALRGDAAAPADDAPDPLSRPGRRPRNRQGLPVA